MSETKCHSNLIFDFMSDRSDMRNNPSACPSYRPSDVAEHHHLSLWFLRMDGRDDGTLATRVTPVTPVVTSAQALKCALTASPRDASGLARSGAPHRTVVIMWPNVWQIVRQLRRYGNRGADRAVSHAVTPHQLRRSCAANPAPTISHRC